MKVFFWLMFEFRITFLHSEIKRIISVIDLRVQVFVVIFYVVIVVQKCHVKKKDIRKFLDGIYVSEKSKIVEEE